jgi:divalent metal cation (Fe/Co/Zn/Cd) transporter
MAHLSKEQETSRENTLLAAFLLSLWAPLTTGIAVVLSSSITQLADFIRRTVELVALFISWQVFRYLVRRKDASITQKAKVEKIAGYSVAAAMACSSIVMVGLAAGKLNTYQPGGNVYLGMAIAGLGFLTNAWFWRRYTGMTREHYSSVIDIQSQLYRAKAFVDLCVIAALAAVALNPLHITTRYIDLSGSIAVSIYLMWSGVRAARTTMLNASAIANNGELGC